MTTASFRPLGARPPHYRTPSPPSSAIEPLSPLLDYIPRQATSYRGEPQGLGLSIFPGSLPQNTNNVLTADDSSGNAPRPRPNDQTILSRKEGAQKRDRKGHVRTGSNMDALATIALATSPTFSQNGSPVVGVGQDGWSQYMYGNGYEHYALDERPAKRARSEKLPSPQTSRRPSRPATSHVAFENLKNDAELLLNFAQNQPLPPLPLPLSLPLSKSEEKKTVRLKKEEDAAQQLSDQTDMSVKTVDTTVEAKINGNIQTSLTNMSTFEEQLKASAAEAAVPGKKARRVQPTTQAPCATCQQVSTTVETGDDQGLTSWIGCHVCQRWFHFICAGFQDSRQVRAVDKYICPECEPEHGPTTFVRKSSRARTAIDYAGLNQGMIQSSSEATPEHHWLKPIKDGTLKFQPDDFARVRPELLTLDFLEKTDWFRRPMVIPAEWNPQFGRPREPLEEPDLGDMVVDQDGNELSIKSLPSCLPDMAEVADYGQDLLDMVMPEHLTVRRVAALHGPELPLDVIDVKSQQTAQKWNLNKWADYYEATGEKTIRNVISLEVSQSKLGRLLQRPKIVRDIDLQDAVWPADVPVKGIQFYCLMSVADCYTDFHIDFGGSSVYYHILKGKKTFFFIPPEEKHLKKYEQWNNSPLQNQTFLGQQTGDCVRVDLSEGDTMLIPSGWIHAVWTPENSLVIGGNFLTRLSYEMQIKINKIEIDTKTALKFRYPLFQKVNWYAAIRYLEEDPLPDEVMREFEDDADHIFLRANPIWHEFGDLESDAEAGEPNFNARFYSRMEMEGLPALRDYLYRTALIASDYDVDGITETKRAAVKKSVPKGHGEPMDLIRAFAVWVAWKTGCVTAPEWVSENVRVRKVEKPKKTESKAERVSSRVQTQIEAREVKLDKADKADKVENWEIDKSEKPDIEIPVEVAVEEETREAKRPKRTPKTSGLGPQRFACDVCRKRRIRCRHRELENAAPLEVEAGPVTAQPNVSPVSAKAVPTESVYPALSTPMPFQEVNGVNALQTESGPASSGKKGRSKACEECRKSKRRCIHDENGKVDPLKAAEPSKPRASTSHKRPRLSDDLTEPEKKFAKTEGNEQAVEEDFVSLLDPSLRPDVDLQLDTLQQPGPDAVLDLDAIQSVVKPDPASQLSTASLASPPASHHDPDPIDIHTKYSASASASASTSPSPSPSLRPTSHSHSHSHVPRAGTSSGDSIGSTATSNALQTHTPKSAASRHSSRQPKPVDRYIPESEGGKGVVGVGVGGGVEEAELAGGKESKPKVNLNSKTKPKMESQGQRPSPAATKKRRRSSGHAHHPSPTTTATATAAAAPNHQHSPPSGQESTAETTPASRVKNLTRLAPITNGHISTPLAQAISPDHGPSADPQPQKQQVSGNTFTPGHTTGVDIEPGKGKGVENGAAGPGVEGDVEGEEEEAEAEDEDSLLLIRQLQEEQFGLRRRR